MMLRVVRFGIVLAALFALAAPSLAQQDCDEDEGDTLVSSWSRIDYSKHHLQPSRLDDLSDAQLSQVRGIIFGKHGRIFKDACLEAYLSWQRWYHRDTTFTNARLSETERENLDLVRMAEARRHKTVQLGDMRLWRDSVIPPKRYPDYRGDELRLLAAEVEAIHGKRFDDTPWMQTYYDERYWYKSVQSYTDAVLNAAERRNLAILDSLQHGGGEVLSARAMGSYHNTPITDSMIAGASLWQLRILRNAVYASYGRRFETPWLQRYFYMHSWYAPDPTFTESRLTSTDRANIALIVAAENRIHEGLATATLDSAVIDGLSYEDARKLRNEIYARHGRTFKDPALQGYFSSFSWYRVNPKFKESDLNAIERQNAQLLLAYQEGAQREIDLYEG